MVQMYIYLGNDLPPWLESAFDKGPVINCRFCESMHYSSREFDPLVFINLLKARPNFTLGSERSLALRRYSLKERAFTPPEPFRLQGWLSEKGTYNGYIIDLFFDPEASFSERCLAWFELQRQIQPEVSKTFLDLTKFETNVSNRT